MQPPLLYLILAAIGLVTGALAGLTGASGMSVLISALLLAGYEIRQVIGLTFVVTLANAAAAIGAFLRSGHVDIRTTLFVAIPAVVAVYIGHDFSGGVPADWLTGAMVLCLLIVGVKFLWAAPEQEEAPLDEPSAGQGKRRLALLLVVGGGIGLVMGVMGGGGAVFISAGLILLLKFPTKTAIGTSVAIMGLAAIPGVAAHWSDGTIRLLEAAIILAVSVPTAVVASRLANRVSARWIKRLLGGYLVAISAVLIFRLLR